MEPRNMEYDSRGRVMNMAQRTRLAGIKRELEAMVAKPSLTQADFERTTDLERQIELIDQGPDSGVREYGSTPLAWMERGGSTRNGGGSYQSRALPNSEAKFIRWAASGDEGARSEAQAEIRAEYRASVDSTLNITTGSDGGDLVPIGMASRIFAKADEVSIWNKLGLTTVRGVGTTVSQPIESGDLNLFVATAESAENDRDAPQYDVVDFTLRKFTKRIDATSEILQDTPTNLVEHFTDYVGRAYGSTIDLEVLTAALAGGTAALTFDSASAVAAAEVPEMAYKLTNGWEHGNSVAWVMSRATEGAIRSIASSSVFTFNPNNAGGMTPQSMLWGWPVFTSSHMPNIGSGNKSIILANWRAMGIRLDPALTVLRDVYSRAAFDECRFHWKFRMDTEVLDAAGIQIGTNPT